MQPPESWHKLLLKEIEAPYYKKLLATIQLQEAQGITIYPPAPLRFEAFNHTPFEQLKVVILGQDPYHKLGQAHGLSFSVPKGIALPPSLKNIYKELQNDCGITPHANGCLNNWATQGVFLLNTYLTVIESKPMSHSKIGWEQFTDAVIKIISEQKKHVVFILWGAYAKSKKIIIDQSKHLVLESAHPSPLSAHNGFWNNKHFSKANIWLQTKGLSEIIWGE